METFIHPGTLRMNLTEERRLGRSKERQRDYGSQTTVRQEELQSVNAGSDGELLFTGWAHGFSREMQGSISGKKLESTKLISGRPPGGLSEQLQLNHLHRHQ
jgi:hypothetical protein